MLAPRDISFGWISLPYASTADIRLLAATIVIMLCITVIIGMTAAPDDNRVLSGVIFNCSYCKMIQSDEGQRVESYLPIHTEADFSHGICSDCHDKRQRKGTPHDDEH